MQTLAIPIICPKTPSDPTSQGKCEIRQYVSSACLLIYFLFSVLVLFGIHRTLIKKGDFINDLGGL